jgi:hypothetical protein
MATLRDDRHALRMDARDRQIGSGRSMPALCLVRSVLASLPGRPGTVHGYRATWTGCQTLHMAAAYTVDRTTQSVLSPGARMGDRRVLG